MKSNGNQRSQESQLVGHNDMVEESRKGETDSRRERVDKIKGWDGGWGRTGDGLNSYQGRRSKE